MARGLQGCSSSYRRPCGVLHTCHSRSPESHQNGMHVCHVTFIVGMSSADSSELRYVTPGDSMSGVLECPACALIVAACVAVHVLQREWAPQRQPKLIRMHSDDLSFSGNAVVNKKWWVWATATLHHGNRSHIVNNMGMLLVVGPLLEFYIGTAWTLALMLVLGAAGWLASYINARWIMADMWAIGVSQFSASRGASPATYGATILAVTIIPAELPNAMARAVASGSLPAGHVACGSVFGLPQWVWVFSVLFLPLFFSTSYGLDLFSARVCPSRHAAPPATLDGVRGTWLTRQTLCRGVVLVLLLWLTYAACTSWLAGSAVAPIHPYQFAIMYFTKVALMKAYFMLFRGSMSSSDDMCHLGGGVAGFIVGLVMRLSGVLDETNSALGMDKEESMATAVVVTLVASMAYLVVAAVLSARHQQ